MRIEETLIELGYAKAGVKLDYNILNRVSRLVDDSFSKKDIGSAFKYVVLTELEPGVVAQSFNKDDHGYYSNHFWKIYPEA